MQQAGDLAAAQSNFGSTGHLAWVLVAMMRASLVAYSSISVAGAQLGRTYQHCIAEFRIVLGQVKTAEYIVRGKRSQDIRDRGGQAQDTLMKHGRGKLPFDAIDRAQPVDQGGGIGMTARGDAREPLPTEQRHVDGRRGDEQALVGADIRSRLRSPDVLLPCLQGERIAGLALEIHRPADDAPRHLAHHCLFGAHEAEIGAARGQRRAQRLSLAAGDVGALAAPLTRRLEHGHRQRVDHTDREHIVGVREISQGIRVFEHAEEVWLGYQQRSEILARVRRQGGHVDPAGGRVEGHLDQLDRLVADDRMHRLAIGGVERPRHQDPTRLRLAVDAHRHQDGLGQAGGTVVQRGIRYVHGHQRSHHGLVFIKQLQRALAGLRLIRRIGAVVLTAGGDLPDCGRDVVVIGAGTDEANRLPVHARTRCHERTDLHFRHAHRYVLKFLCTQIGRDLVEKVIDLIDTDHIEHVADIFFCMRDKGHDLACLRSA